MSIARPSELSKDVATARACCESKPNGRDEDEAVEGALYGFLVSRDWEWVVHKAGHGGR